MRTLNHYISHSFLVTFMTTLVVLTFVGSIGGLYTASTLISRGIEWKSILMILVSGVPAALAYTIPISILTSTLLVFGRLSASSEIVAIKACGISLWQVVRWMMPVTFLLTTICLYVNGNLNPHSHYVSRSALTRLKSGDPTKLIEEGKAIKVFDGLTIIIGKKKGKQLEDIRIYDLRNQGKKREIKAETGMVSVATNSTDIILDLNKVTIDPFSFDHPGVAYAEKWSERIKNDRSRKKYTKGVSDYNLGELYAQIKDENFGANETKEDTEKMRMRILVEINERIAKASSCLVFVFLGIPLGIKSHRKESSIGMALSLVLVFFFYMSISVAKQLADNPVLHPDKLVWLPVIISLILGSILINRQN